MKYIRIGVESGLVYGIYTETGIYTAIFAGIILAVLESSSFFLTNLVHFTADYVIHDLIYNLEEDEVKPKQGDDNCAKG